jgi:signal transduction histidine kinase
MMESVALHRPLLRRLAQRLRDERVTLTERWQQEVSVLVTVDRLDGFPSPRLLDQIPELIVEIARCLQATDADSMEVNQEALSRAAEVARLHQIQHTTMRQLLREYHVLSELLDNFLVTELGTYDDGDHTVAVEAMRRVGHAVRVLQQHTVDTFVATYTQTLERQTTQLRQFSRLVSHEIRQPLAVLQVIAHALPLPPGDLEAQRILDMHHRSVSRLADVTGRLERLARITNATDLSMTERDVDLSEIAHSAAAQLSAAAAESGVEVRVSAGLPVLRLDPLRTELIFVNLIANAIKFCDPNKPARYVEIYPGGDGGTSVIVRDNGLGMPPTRLQTIFREFVRAHGQRDDHLRAWGLGLGLSIVRDCMDHANGSVRVDSIEGRGTTFKLTWPAK